MTGTWIAEDLHQPRGGRRLAWAAVPVVLVGVAALLFLLTSPPRAISDRRDPGHFAQLVDVDLLPGYDVDAERRTLGPARALASDGQRLFVPADTPYTGERPCPALRTPETDAPGTCHVLVWFAQDGRSVERVTLLRPGGPGELLLSGRLLTVSPERIGLRDGTSLVPSPSLRTAECGSRGPEDLTGTDVVLGLDETTGAVRQITCRS